MRNVTKYLAPIGLAALILALVLIVPLSLAQTPTPTPQPRTLSRVAGTEIMESEFLPRLRFERALMGLTVRTTYRYFRQAGLDAAGATAQTELVFLNPGRENPMLILGSQEESEAHAERVLSQMEQERLIKSWAGAREITASDAEIDAEIVAYMTGLGFGEGETMTLLAQLRDFSTLSEDDMRDLFAARVLSQKLVEGVTTDPETRYFVTLEETWAEVRHILVSFPAGRTPPTHDDNPTFEAAETILAEIRGGLDFASAAERYSEDAISSAEGGLLPMERLSGYPEGFRQTLENGPLGEPLGPIRTHLGYHLLLIEARETRPLDDETLDSRRRQAYARWVADQTTAARIRRTDNWQRSIPEFDDYNTMLGDIFPLPTPTPGR